MLNDSVESLPIAQEPVLISLHVTPPTQQVMYAGSDGILDIASDTYGDDYAEQASVPIDLEVCHASRVSISYDVAKVDDMTAAEFIHKLKGLLDDPELLLL